MGETSLELSRDEVLLILEKTEHQIKALTESPQEFLIIQRQTQAEAGQRASAMVPLEWVEALLEQLPSLRETRYVLVPRRMTETNFWEGYFGALFGILEAELRLGYVGKPEDDAKSSGATAGSV